MLSGFGKSLQMNTHDGKIAELIRKIEEGDCVAFVGAGFSAAANFPQWRTLLLDLAKKARVNADPAKASSLELIESMFHPGQTTSSRDFEIAAQLIEDALGSDLFREAIRKRFDPSTVQDGAMDDRLKYLREIPFKAIVTTNFDPLISGDAPNAEAYRRLLRERRADAWQRSLAIAANVRGDRGFACPVVQLHGRLDKSLVLTRTQYRKRLYGDPAYLTVLRSLFATSTVLFLGYSLNDAYLNELRAELVEAFSADDAEAQQPLAWAIMSDVSEAAGHYYEKHEGMKIVSYKSCGSDHSGFDHLLEQIHRESNPVARLGKSLSGKRILWVDEHMDNNDWGIQLLKRASLNRFELIQAQTLENALSDLKSDRRIDLVISAWDYQEKLGRRLLTEVARLRSAGQIVPPLIIFTSDHEWPTQRSEALGLGAADYTWQWEQLFPAIEQILSPRQYPDS